jgi:flavin reductase (DIM6/NTAB) family NADH-FMN oxidoreductase RutF
VIVRVVAHPAPGVQLLEREAFDRFSVAADGELSTTEIANVLRRSDAGSLDGEDTAWISVDWIRRSVGVDAGDRWGAGFDEMVRYAASRDWYSEGTRSIQAHIERGGAGDFEASEASSTLSGLEAQHFIAAFREHPAGVAVITADIGAGPVGLTATSVSSVSADPAMLVFSVADASSSTPVIRAASTLVVHLLSSRDISIAQLCATSGIDRFADTSIWDRLPTGEPYFTGVKRWIRAEVVSTVSAGTSTLMIVHALEASPTVVLGAPTDDAPLVYHKRTWHSLNDQSVLNI